MASLSIFLDRRKETKAGLFPLKFCISHRRQKAYISTGIRITDSQWSGGKIITHPHRVAFNNVLKVRKLELEKKLIILSTERNVNELSALQIRDLLISDTTAQKVPSFKEYLDAVVKKLTKKNTILNYRKTESSIKKYLDYKNASYNSLSFADITAEWLADYDNFLANVRKNATNSRGLYLSCICTLFNLAISKKVISDNIYPFKEFKIKTEETIKRSLPVNTLNIILCASGRCSKEQLALDVFKLSFFLIGINLGDLFKLTNDDVVQGRIAYRRSKTGRLYNIKIEPEAEELISKYRASKGDMLLDFGVSQQDFMYIVNRYLSKFCEERLSEKGVTSYWARHSWATCASELDIPKETISASLGHGAKSVTDVYINFNLKKVDEANRKVIDYALGIGETPNA